MNLFLGETYFPEYVRLRMLGCEKLGGALAAYHYGSTSTELGGCDGAVVPTLVDREREEVLVDSKHICLRLDAEAPEDLQLHPADLAAAVDEQLAIVDDMPNYQMLMGRNLRATERQENKTDELSAFSLRKVAWCTRYLEEHSDDETLARAYVAKRAKEASAAERLFSPDEMRIAYGRAEASLHDLEHKLGARDDAWIFGDRVTLADLFWGIELIRMCDVGMATTWEGGRLPRVERLFVAAQMLPAIRRSVLYWPEARF